MNSRGKRLDNHHTCLAIGTRITVYFEDDDAWYKGTVAGRRKHAKPTTDVAAASSPKEKNPPGRIKVEKERVDKQADDDDDDDNEDLEWRKEDNDDG